MFGFGKKKPLRGVRVAVLATDGVEQVELAAPWKALRKAGAELYLISPRLGKIQAVRGLRTGDKIPVDATIDEVSHIAFAALLLPGGIVSPERLRQNEQVLRFVRAFVRAGKPIAAICHAPWVLASAGALKGRTLTSSQGIQEDLRNAGATWKNAPVVVDGNLLTGRGSKDIKRFNKRVVAHFDELVNG
jgi:protease I